MKKWKKKQSNSNFGSAVVFGELTQPCPMCGQTVGAVAGTKEAICKNCGFKDPCCE